MSRSSFQNVKKGWCLIMSMTNDEFVAALISTGYTPELALKMAEIVQRSIDNNTQKEGK